MTVSADVLNRFPAEARPSATYKVMDRVAARRASGAAAISLSAGEPDFDTPEHIREAGIAAIRAGHTRYTQVAGLRALREAIAAKFQRENGLNVEWRDTLVCNGGKQVIFNALAATLNEGDEVVVPAPYWVSYPEIVQLCGAKSVIVPCGAESGFKLTADALQAAITQRTRWLVLNSPSNPTGAVYSRAELLALAEVLLAHPGVLVLSRFAGAAHECKEALLVNPYDTEAVAGAINRALSMPLAERRERHAAMYETLVRNDISHWAERFIAALTRPRAENWPFSLRPAAE